VKGKKAAGKWIEATAEMATADVAYQALRLRLDHVLRMLSLAAYQHTDDLEHVHRLRVGCRRATAALSAFRPLIGGKIKPLRRWLKRLRDAAGPARDVDVLLLELQNESATGTTRMRYLLEPFQQHREKLQRSLVKIAERAQVESPEGRLLQVINKCLNSIPLGKRADNGAFGPFAKLGLSASAGVMLQLGENLLPADNKETGQAHLPDIERMHELRIAVKRFRYSIELFHSAFPAALRHTMYPQIEEMQQRLGTLNDHATMQKQYQWLMATPIPSDRVVDLAARIVQQVEAVQDERLALFHWWTPQRAGTLRTELDLLLSSQTTYHTTTD
jgi:CHAD domain-containing protein